MPWTDALTPVRMTRVAVVAPWDALRRTLVAVADTGSVELDGVAEARTGPAALRLQRLDGASAAPVLTVTPVDLDAIERARRTDLLAGEAQLEERLHGAVRRGRVAALAGWCPSADVPAVEQHLVGTGGTIVPLPAPRGIDPPTLLSTRGDQSGTFTPLVTTFGTVPYADFDPSWPAGIAYVTMFGLMFGDVGHGLLLLVAAVLLRCGFPRRLGRWRRLWPFFAGAGTVGVLAGFAYGEFFGPTGVLPVLWLDPLERPVPLIAAALGFGAVMLALAYLAGTVNRLREGGFGRALYAAAGCAGFALYLGLATTGAALYLHRPWLVAAGAVLAVAGVVLVCTGLFALTAGGLGGVAETGVRLFDVVVRIGTNTVSFARLAAFGLTHAALAEVVWRGTTNLAHHGFAPLVLAMLLFTVGTVVTFALEALVAGVQALRLEFYELFSRLFDSQGRPFCPWHVPTTGITAPADMEVAP
ncbi:V-type ATPase 116kDa subunit family protein [Streptomyces sp. NPDC059176]|uniref:V-type ATPase 116kDa subunit family protein n=1 Tax=unclassified Streptomyces TaxID=2593676 RepID=UPI0036AC4B16